MASITKTPKGYRAQIYVRGERDSQCFRTRREAESWAATRELEFRDGATKLPGDKYTLRKALQDYAEKVSPSKDGEKWERLRLAAFERMPFLPVDKRLSDISSNDIGIYRDARLKQVKSSTVLREISLLSAVFSVAIMEWGWIKENPVTNARKPKKPKHREVTIARRQVKRMVRAMGYTTKQHPKTISAAVAICFLTALRTGMRAKELCNLRWADVRDGYCILHKTKTDPRDVPLTPKATRLINRMRGYDPEFVFGISANSLDAMFRKYRNRINLSGFTFHDSRHTAATWIAGRMKSDGTPAQQAVFDLCKMFGWKNINQALVYYNPSAADIAKRIS